MVNPKLRFKADDGTEFPEWMQMKICDVAEVNPKSLVVPDCFYYIDLESVKQGKVICELVLMNKGNAPSRAKRVVSTGDVLFQSVRPYQRNNLFLDDKFHGAFVASTGYAVLRAKKSYLANFIYYVIHADNFLDQVLMQCDGGTYPSISSMNLNNICIDVPCFEEQRKIADFLSTFDSKVEAKEQQLEALQETKKGLLQQIFSQQLRFKADDGTDFPEWEAFDFDSCFEFISNKAFSREFLCDEDTPVKCIHYGDILIKYPTITDIKKVRVTSLKCPELANGVSRLKDGDVVFADTAEDYTAGKAIEIAGLSDNVEAIAGLHTFACRPKYLFATGYLGYFLNSSNYHKQIIPLLQGIKVYSINKKAIKGTKIFAPCFDEQRKIAEFLSAFDEKIEAVKRQLEALKEIKKGLLQQMFV